MISIRNRLAVGTSARVDCKENWCNLRDLGEMFWNLKEIGLRSGRNR
jgi:hypothetical protein